DHPELVAYYGDVYGAGPMILFRQLEVLTSRAQVLAAIGSVLGSPHALSVDSLIAALEQQTGLDLTAYAAGWLHGTGVPVWPRFDLTYNGATLVVHQMNATAAPRGCKFHVSLHDSTGTMTQLVEVNTYTGGPDQTLPVPTPAFTVSGIDLD